MLITYDNVKYRLDIEASSFDEAISKASKLLGFDVDQIDFCSSEAVQEIGGLEIWYKGNSSSLGSNEANDTNYSILKPNGDSIGKFSCHPAGHLEFKGSDYNATNQHINISFAIGKGKSVSGHITYNN